jgi:hypothetical protein
MSSLKAWSTRRLRECGLVGADRRVWARHGSTRWLGDLDALRAAVSYVVWQQGQPMAVWECEGM